MPRSAFTSLYAFMAYEITKLLFVKLKTDLSLYTPWGYILALGTRWKGLISFRSCHFVCLFFGATATLQWATASSFMRFLDHTQRRTTVGGTPLDERSARHKDLYLTTHNTHKRQASMPPVGLETTISASKRPRGHWDRLLPNYLRRNNPSSPKGV